MRLLFIQQKGFEKKKKYSTNTTITTNYLLLIVIMYAFTISVYRAL